MIQRPRTAARRPGILVTVLVSMCCLGACAVGSSSATASMTSGQRPVSELAPSSPRPDAGPAPAPQQLPDLSEIPGFEDLPELPPLPDLGGSQECAEVMAAFTELTILGMMPGGEVRSGELSAQLRQALPGGLQDDLDSVLSMIERARAAGFLESAELLMSDEFISATTPIFDWIVQGCPGAQTD